MMPDLPMLAGTVAAGFLMGLAGSLHCAGQCGGIASSLLIATGQGRSGRQRAQALLATQLGRTVTYTIAGCVVGIAGDALGQLFDLAGLQPVLRALGAAMLLWVGFSLIGVVPGPQLIDRRVIAASTFLLGGRQGPVHFGTPSALLLGMAWGIAPCAMVYNALMTAMLSGTGATGALFMMSFGLATVPAVALTAAGAAQIAVMGATLPKAALRKVVGIAIVALGFGSIVMPAASLTALCLS
ncbi:hypothetical protein GOZ80_10780 [Agrobacterium vitis]|uniref:Urease accessory protein UreH-like transmembrane domain-containing protein n=2 Tax=Agrobacterium vitis TaxID=373 RepID=A0A1S2E0Y0_AGRVI|nr:sulfite exporter TauE/SafE family protein [Agrobacterium vitis]MUO80894.1 hypothetical protein [Agrobacterium vitis]MUO94802.1 hypothetical protein [Agrobacterium vitis]MUP05436.1 hypothetical protein [Agrobacterium vitis]MUZ81570.1 hypothetical protein [Agrobacterium vitis]MVA56682.1 hypothetical protein [Agrobacterium vitis]